MGTVTRADVEARLDPRDPVRVRVARKAWRCRAADPIDRWEVTTPVVATAGHPFLEAGAPAGSSTTWARTEEAARDLAGGRPGTRAGRDTVRGEAVITPVPNRFHETGRCLVDIAPGDVYIEDMNDALAYESGTRFCLPCGLALWERR